MKNKLLRITLFLCGLLIFSGISLAPEAVSGLSSDKNENSTLDDLSFSVYNQSDTHAFLCSPKEDLTAQYHQHKIKFLCASLYLSAIINYRYSRLYYQSVLAHSFILGRTTALRAPPCS